MKKTPYALIVILSFVLASCNLFNPPTPVMSVLDGTTPLANAGTHAFENVVADGDGGLTSMALFTIQNTGTADLTVSVAIASGDITDFDKVADPAPTIAPGGSSPFTLSFDPLTTGSKSANVQISSNDPNASAFAFTITGDGDIHWVPVTLYPGTSTRTDVVAFFGREPDDYFWGTDHYTPDTLPIGMYSMKYNEIPSGSVFVLINNSSGQHLINEIQIVETADFRCYGTLAIGLTPDQIFAIVGNPTQTITGQAMPPYFSQDVFYENINSTSGYDYYDNSAHKVREFFLNGLNNCFYIYGPDASLEMAD